MGDRECIERWIGIFDVLANRADRLAGGGTAATDAANQLEAALTRIAATLDPEEQPPQSPTGKDFETFFALRWVTTLEHDASASAMSIPDVMLRLHWMLSPLRQSSRRFYFRGQTDIRWPVQSGAKRQLDKLAHPMPMVGAPSDYELNALAQFRERFLSGETWAHEEDRKRFSTVRPDSSAWWSLMQHYEGGTRLLDISSSVLEGLFFACVGWDGSIDNQTYGVLHVFPEQNARIMSDELEGSIAPNDVTPDLAADMFRLRPAHEPRFYFPTKVLRNERVKAQRGAFLLWPDIGASCPVGALYIRIHKDAKIAIARELFQFGINPRVIVEGPKGESAYRTLCDHLEIEPRPHD